MALKGSAVIELTDTKTGKTEIVKHDNMITNAINDIISIDPLNLKWGSTRDNISQLFPIVPNLIGGIVLFEDALEEDPAKYFAPGTNAIVGYSDMQISPAADSKRGSLNQTESGVLEDGSGYRFVFDFATSQGNGTISSLALTSKEMGSRGYGSEYVSDSSYSGSQSYIDVADSTPDQFVTDLDKYAYNKFADVVYVDWENKTAYSVRATGQKSVAINKYSLLMDTVGLRTVSVVKSATPELVSMLSTSTFLGTVSGSGGTVSANVGFCDGGDGYIWGFQLQSNASNGTKMLWIKIKIADWTFTEGTWTMPISVGWPGYFWDASNEVGTGFIVHNGLAYFKAYDAAKVVIINTENPTDSSVVDITNDWDTYSAYTYFSILGDVVLCYDGYFAGRVFYPRKSCYWSMNRPIRRLGPFTFKFSYQTGSSSSTYKRGVKMCLDTTYLATINNLSTPVQKTADKTMKITYILREE